MRAGTKSSRSLDKEVDILSEKMLQTQDLNKQMITLMQLAINPG
jgi:hypothetical protein